LANVFDDPVAIQFEYVVDEPHAVETIDLVPRRRRQQASARISLGLPSQSR